MNVIFLGTTGIYHPTVAAHMYLSRERITNFSQLYYWGDFQAESLGDPMLIGYDTCDNRVYSLGAGIDVEMTRKSIEQLTKILGHGDNELIIQSIFIRADKMILNLYRLAKLKILQKPVNRLVGYILIREVDSIRQQVKEFKNRVGFD